MNVHTQPPQQHDDTPEPRGLSEAEARARGFHSDNEQYYETYSDNAMLEYKFNRFGGAHGFLTEEAIDLFSKQLDERHPGMYDKLVEKRAGKEVSFTASETKSLNSMYFINVIPDVITKQLLGEWGPAEQARYWEYWNSPPENRGALADVGVEVGGGLSWNAEGGDISGGGPSTPFSARPTGDASLSQSDADEASWHSLASPAFERGELDQENRSLPGKREEDELGRGK